MHFRELLHELQLARLLSLLIETKLFAIDLLTEPMLFLQLVRLKVQLLNVDLK